MGESITVEIFEDIEETTERLALVLNGDHEAAKLLAEEVHREVILYDVNIPEITEEMEFTNLGIVIDPIDATNEYIKAEHTTSDIFPEIPATGLECVTVLIGVFNILTGLPILGVINQPFHTKINEV